MSLRPAVAVVDHGAGNLVSIGQGLERAGARVRIADGPAGLEGAAAVVLPGVGATGAAMSRLGQAGLTAPLRAWEGPLLGICVGLQLFFDSSEEDGGPCLGLERGTVRRLEGAPLLPHIGWNSLTFPGNGAAVRDRLFEGLGPGDVFYFVHSYAPAPEDPSIVTAHSRYPNPFTAAVRRGPRVGLQFHPERSGRAGLRVLANFVDEVRGRPRPPEPGKAAP